MSVEAASNVVVVGGGIVGASLAWHLAHETNVTVIAEELGGVATPKSFAWINAAAGNPEFYYNFRHRSMQRWAEIAEEIPDFPITLTGSLNWNMSPEELEEYQEGHSEWGYDIVRVEKTEMLETEPELADDLFPEWGLKANEEGAMEADLAAIQLIANAEEHFGAKVLETAVTGFLKGEDGQISGVVTSEGEVEADHVVLAAGLGSVELLAAEGIKLPLSGREGLLVNSQPIETKLLNTLINGEGLHMRQTLEGRIRSGADFAGGESDEDPLEAAEAHFLKVQAAFKAGGGGDELEFDYYTIGVRPDPEDGYPILGATGLDGVTVAVMHSGVTNAAIVGELLTKQIMQGESDPILENFRLDRFHGNSTL